LLLVFNAHHDLVEFTLPECSGGSHWKLLIDTNITEERDLGRFETGDTYGTTGRSLLVFALETEPESGTRLDKPKKARSRR
jgi:glycogen operon protein